MWCEERSHLYEAPRVLHYSYSLRTVIYTFPMTTAPFLLQLSPIMIVSHYDCFPITILPFLLRLFLVAIVSHYDYTFPIMISIVPFLIWLIPITVVPRYVCFPRHKRTETPARLRIPARVEGSGASARARLLSDPFGVDWDARVHSWEAREGATHSVAHDAHHGPPVATHLCHERAAAVTLEEILHARHHHRIRRLVDGLNIVPRLTCVLKKCHVL